MHLHVLAQGRWMRIRLIATMHTAVVRFVGSVYVGMLLPIRRVRKSPVAARVFAFERLFA